MKSKQKRTKNERVLLFPGAGGWEAWKGVNGGGLSLAMSSAELRAFDVDGIPSGDLSMAFPVRDVSSLPFKAPTADEALFGDMAEMHIERLGMRPGIDAGVLSDCFEVDRGEAESLLQPVVLAPPLEGGLPKRSPKAFDVSARCLPLPAEGVVLWQELGRWVFAIARAGKALHFQALAASELGCDAGREVRLSLSQLQMQGLLEAPPEHCQVWIPEGEGRPAPAILEALGQGFVGEVSVLEKPAPGIPARPSQLLPADVRAERAAKRKKQQAILLVGGAVVLYFGVFGWLGWTLIQQNRTNAAIQAQVDEIAPYVEGISAHHQKWDELQPVTDLEHWPVELMFSSAGAIPKEGGLRLKRADIYNQLKISDTGEKTLERSIRLQGESGELEQASMFNLNLKESDALREYFWTTPPPVEDAKSGRWGFMYTAEHNPVLAADQ